MSNRPSKLALFRRLIARGHVAVHLDARKPGVVLPERLLGSECVHLAYGYHLPIQTVDLVASDAGLHATLSFSREPHETFVPWSAVFAIAGADGRGTVYPEDVPDGVVIEPGTKAATSTSRGN